mmetsp:Transcript_17857/g.44130  ORF Transcript_17857/g.44130 Transcript_17857/m.44130 type:complete len:273 (+) Transcript_17857:296-1114(+)
MSVALGGGNDSVDQLLGLALQFVVNSWFAQLLQGFDTGSHGQWVSGKSSGLVHGSSGGDHFHNFLAATVGTDWKSSSDNLTHSGDIGGNSKVFLGSSVRNTESSHDFVKDQKSSVVGGHFTESLQEFLVGLDESRVSNDGFKDDGSDFILVFLQDLLDRFEVVVFGTESGLGGRSGNSWRVGKTQSGNTGSSLDQEGIGMSVVASLKLDDLFAVGEGTNQTDHSHASFSSRVGETNHLDRWNGSDDSLGQFVFQRTWGSEGSSLVHGGLDGI